MYINKIISDSSKYHQENKDWYCSGGDVREAGKMQRFDGVLGKALLEGRN